MQAMILAAGFGTRLLPHTLIRPKPLFPVLNTPLLLLIVRRLQNLGFDRIVVNCHYLREQVVDALDGISGVIVQEEEVILGTAGGIRAALSHFRNEPLFVCNGDIYHTIDISGFFDYHRGCDCPVSLAMHNYPRFNNVMVKDGKVESFDNRVEFTQLAFTGLHILDTEALEYISRSDSSCIIDVYRKMLDNDCRIGCFRADEGYWTDMGTPEDYLALHQGLLADTIPCWEEAGKVRRPYCIAKRAKLPVQIELSDWVCIGDALIENGSRLERVVIWDNVFIPSGSKLTDIIVSSND